MDIRDNKKHLEEMKTNTVKLCENVIVIVKEIENFTELESIGKMAKLLFASVEQFASLAGVVEFAMYMSEGKQPPSMTTEKLQELKNKIDAKPETFSFEDIERELREKNNNG